MAARRIRDVQNSCHRNVPAIRKRMTFNYAYLNPEELIDLDLKAGDMIEITSDAGTIVAAVEPDPTLRRAVVSITHGWGGLPEDTIYERDGSNTGILISTDRDFDPINAMPRMSAVPVNITPVRSEEHTSELQSLMRISYAGFCLKQKKQPHNS